MPPVDAITPPPLPSLYPPIIMYYIMTFYAMRDFPIFLRSATAAKETTDNSRFWKKKSSHIGHIRKQISDVKGNE